MWLQRHSRWLKQKVREDFNLDSWLLSVPCHIAILGGLVAERSQSNQTPCMVPGFQEPDSRRAPALKPGKGRPSPSLPSSYTGQSKRLNRLPPPDIRNRNACVTFFNPPRTLSRVLGLGLAGAQHTSWSPRAPLITAETSGHWPSRRSLLGKHHVPTTQAPFALTQ